MVRVPGILFVGILMLVSTSSFLWIKLLDFLSFSDTHILVFPYYLFMHEFCCHCQGYVIIVNYCYDSIMKYRLSLWF